MGLLFVFAARFLGAVLGLFLAANVGSDPQSAALPRKQNPRRAAAARA
jgi:hypothetical protein